MKCSTFISCPQTNVLFVVFVIQLVMSGLDKFQRDCCKKEGGLKCWDLEGVGVLPACYGWNAVECRLRRVFAALAGLNFSRTRSTYHSPQFPHCKFIDRKIIDKIKKIYWLSETQ